MKISDAYFLALGNLLGLEITPENNGTLIATINDQIPIVIHGNDDAKRIDVTAVVAPELPESVSYSSMMDMLDTALGPLFDAPGIGRDPESGAIVLYMLVSYATTTPAEFAESVRAFMDLAKTVTDRLANL